MISNVKIIDFKIKKKIGNSDHRAIEAIVIDTQRLQVRIQEIVPWKLIRNKT